jgi:hypothetical protein
MGPIRDEIPGLVVRPLRQLLDVAIYGAGLDTDRAADMTDPEWSVLVEELIDGAPTHPKPLRHLRDAEQ